MSDPTASSDSRPTRADQQRLGEVKRELNRQAIRLVQERCETSRRQLWAIYQGRAFDSGDSSGP